jgi:pimeloyl-ACP methyl ester carboxylesterase
MADLQLRGLRFHVQRVPAKASARVAVEASGGVPGPPPTVVLIHGLAIDSMSGLYLALAGPLADAGADALLYDLRGHGLTERPPTGYGLADSVADLTALLDALDLHRPLHLVGSSYGGAVALAFALAHPQRVAGIALVEGQVPGPDWGVRMAERMTEMAEHRRLRPMLRELAARVPGLDESMTRRARGLFASTTIVTDIAATPPVTDAQLRSIACPVLAVYGSESDLLPLGRQVAGTVPDGELHVVPEGGHFLLATDAAAVRDLVVDWVGRTARAPAPAEPSDVPASTPAAAAASPAAPVSVSGVGAGG